MDIRAITLKYLNNRNINFDANELLEAIYFQYCIVPVYENLAIKDVPFSYNWVHFYGHMGEAELNKLRVEPVVIHFNPLHTVAETGVDFARLYIGNNNSGSSAVYEISADMSAASATLKNIPGIEGLYDLTG